MSQNPITETLKDSLREMFLENVDTSVQSFDGQIYCHNLTTIRAQRILYVQKAKAALRLQVSILGIDCLNILPSKLHFIGSSLCCFII